MNIICPACATRYAIADSAIGADGRVVRCARCRHSWFQEGPGAGTILAEAPLAPASVAVEPAASPAAQPAPVASTQTPPPPTPTTPPIEAAVSIPAPDVRQARDFAETPSSFAHEPPFRPRRHPATVWVIALIGVALAALAVIAAMVEFGVPGWLPVNSLGPFNSFWPGNGFMRSAPDLVLDFPANRQQPRPLPNSGSFFNVSGSIRNAGSSRREVPTLLIVLRDSRRQIVYTLETAPPKSVLAPGESETIDQAIIDAPTSARTAEIGWKPR